MNVCKYIKLSSMKLKNQRMAHSMKSWVNPTLRMFSTQASNYFKRVLKDETPEKFRGISLERNLEVMRENDIKKEKEIERISRSQKHKEILGIKDYELEDYKIDGALNDTPNYKGLIQGKIPQDMIEASRYELEIVNNLIPNMEVAIFNIPYDVKKDELVNIFEKHGVLSNLEIFNGVNSVPSYAIATYKSNTSYEN